MSAGQDLGRGHRPTGRTKASAPRYGGPSDAGRRRPWTATLLARSLGDIHEQYILMVVLPISAPSLYNHLSPEFINHSESLWAFTCLGSVLVSTFYVVRGLLLM